MEWRRVEMPSGTASWASTSTSASASSPARTRDHAKGGRRSSELCQKERGKPALAAECVARHGYGVRQPIGSSMTSRARGPESFLAPLSECMGQPDDVVLTAHHILVFTLPFSGPPATLPAPPRRPLPSRCQRASKVACSLVSSWPAPLLPSAAPACLLGVCHSSSGHGRRWLEARAAC